MEQSRQELIEAINQQIPTNNNELVQASNIRSVFISLVNSLYNKADDQINNNISVPTWVNTIAYPIDFIVEFDDKFWKSKQNNNTNHVPAENTFWTEISKASASQNIDLSNFYLKQELQTAGQALVALANIIGLQEVLNGKANVSHKHIAGDLENLPAKCVVGNDTNSVGNGKHISITEVKLYQVTLVNGVVVISDPNITSSSVVFVTPTNVGTLSAVPLRVTCISESCTIANNQSGDNALINVEIWY